MSWSINTAWHNPKLRFLSVVCALMAIAWTQRIAAQELRAPSSVSAGEETKISTSGSGRATFYLIGPGVSSKSEINLGEDIRVRAEDVKYAGEYLAIVCSDTCHSTAFTVTAAQPADLIFLVHPSRVPVNQPDAVSGVAFPFDHFGNLVLAPVPVNFRVNTTKESLFSRPILTQGGVAWFRTASGKSSGTLQITASIDTLSARRVLQQVASDPCNLRIKGERTPKGIVVETEPVRDCTGNLVSDGTVVTFTLAGNGEKSTIDVPIKAGVAQTRVADSGPVVVSAASGVAMGNELHIGAK
jgi:hypothetical protein